MKIEIFDRGEKDLIVFGKMGAAMGADIVYERMSTPCAGRL